MPASKDAAASKDTTASKVMKVSDVMTPDVLSVRPEATVIEAAQLMLQKRISGVPVTNALGDLVGIVSEGDFLRRAETGTGRQRPKWIEFFMGPGRLADEYVRLSSRKISDVMTHEVKTVPPSATLEQVVRLMERHNIKRVPVVENGKVVGIVTRANLLHAVAGFAGEIAPLSAEDGTIRDRLLAALKGQPWTPVTAVDITVRNGIVQLSGVITDDRQRQALRVAAENIPGVKKVEDNLAWVEPVSGVFVEAGGGNWIAPPG
jgi:CBS-domain-containing membrane protein